MTIQGETDWRRPLPDYLETDILPPDEKEASRLKHRVARFAVLNGIYSSHPFLRCLSREEGRDILQEIHESDCGSQLAGWDLANKALRVGFFWPTLKKDPISRAKVLG
ncbi:UNVERIFIED_CONTAM: hypothetical protein Slati_3716300 [Sesamum latifolium]|uniref:Integrase zinc-binding domain-containing protein n=1 Tax=Sesamum latifolium TaxID=2727402 RepID=A0AAW2U6N1_9LAMI